MSTHNTLTQEDDVAQNFVESTSDKRIRIVASVTVVLLALCAGILSYDSLRILAIEAGISPLLAILFPITIDGLILSGSLLLLFYANKGRTTVYGFLLTALGVVASIAGNVAVSDNTLISQLVHATSPVVLFLSLEALTTLLRHRSKEQMAQKKQKAREEEVAASSAAAEQKEVSVAQAPVETQQVAVAPVEPTPVASPAVSSVAPDPVAAEVVETLHEESEFDASDFAALVRDLEDQAVSDAPTEEAVEAPVSAANAPSAPPVIQTPEWPAQRSTSSQKAAPEAVTEDDGRKLTAREQIQLFLAESPEMEDREIAAAIDADKKYVRKLIREEREKLATVAG